MNKEKMKDFGWTWGWIVAVIVAVVAVGIVGMSSPQEDAFGYMSELPEKDPYFEIISREVHAGAPIDICSLNEGIYKRPEFYPNWPTAKARDYEKHDYSRWYVYGYGSYPADVGYDATNLKKGSSFTQCMILRSGFGVETWQGIRLVASAEGPFDVSVEPEYLKLGPSFPEFSYDWAEKITLSVTTRNETPPGIYIISVNAQRPDDAHNQQWLWETIRMDATEMEKQYALDCIENIRYALERNQELDPEDECSNWLAQRARKYVPSGGLVSIGRDMFTVQIEVPEA